jgi:hypothetical protein
MKKKKAKRSKAFRILRVFIIIIIVIIIIPLAAMGFSLIGRKSPDQVIPDSYSLYARIPNPVRLGERILSHETLPQILALKELAPVIPAITGLGESGLLKKPWVRMFCGGRLDAAVFQSGIPAVATAEDPDGAFLAAWNSAFLSPVLHLVPFFAGRFSIPGLYYVQAGKKSRFEYRAESGGIYYIGLYHNLVIASDNRDLFESVLAGTSRDGDRRGQDNKGFYSRDFDAAFLLSPSYLLTMLSGADPVVLGALEKIDFSGPIEAALTIQEREISAELYAAVSSRGAEIAKILAKNSGAANITRLLPDSAQYASVLAAGVLKDIMDAASSIPGSNITEPWKKADSSSRSLLGMNIEELLYSWSGGEFAVAGLEGRPSPVLLVEIKNETKRKEVFDRAFKSIVLNENIKLNLDGNRLPRIELPSFLSSLLLSMGISIPSPYYTVHDGYLFMSESAESLLAAVNAARKNSALLKTDLWKALSKSGPAKSSISIFYSLDRSLPFFLKGNAAVNSVLALYRQGLAQLSLDRGLMKISLKAVPGSGGGIAPDPGYPFDLGGKAGNRVYVLPRGKKNEGRILLTKDGLPALIDPAERSVKTFEIPVSVWNIPAEGIDGAVWIVNSQGRIVLTDGDFNPKENFPVISGLRLSAQPVSFEGRLFLSDEDATVYTVDAGGKVQKWGMSLPAPLRSPPSFLNKNGVTYAAFYPKSFLGGIWLTDGSGVPRPGWPLDVSGIAFGSPIVFDYENNVYAAFITQAGELSVYGESGAVVRPFPIALDGVFYLQPVFSGGQLWAVSGAGVLFKISLDGDALSQKIPNLEVREGGFIAAVPVSGGNDISLFITGDGNALYGYGSNFASLEGFPLPVWGHPAIGDINGDGKMEIAGAGMDNKIYRWQFK